MEQWWCLVEYHQYQGSVPHTFAICIGGCLRCVDVFGHIMIRRASQVAVLYALRGRRISPNLGSLYTYPARRCKPGLHATYSSGADEDDDEELEEDEEDGDEDMKPGICVYLVHALHMPCWPPLARMMGEVRNNQALLSVVTGRNSASFP